VLGDAVGVVARGVVHRVGGELPILQVQGRGHDLAHRLVPAALREDQRGRHRGDDEHDCGCRHQAREAARPPAPDVHLAALSGPHQLPGEEEPRHDEEDVDAAGDPAHPHVVDHDEDDRERTQALQLGAEARRRAGSRHREPTRLLTGRHAALPLRVDHAILGRCPRADRWWSRYATGS
jgi:hypothetical protein